jgi:hypothetical protein
MTVLKISLHVHVSEKNPQKMKTPVLITSQVWQISGICKNFKLFRFEIFRLSLLCGWYLGSSGLLRGVVGICLPTFLDSLSVPFSRVS